MNKTPKLKNYLVALDRPGSGWSDTFKARSLDHAKSLFTKKYREQPDTICQVAPDFKEKEEAEAKQRRYDELGPTNFLIALELSGNLKNLESTIDNKNLIKAIRNYIKLERKINPHLFKELKKLI